MAVGKESESEEEREIRIGDNGSEAEGDNIMRLMENMIVRTKVR